MQKVNYILISRKYACNCMATGPWLVIHLSINFMCTFDNWKWKNNTEVLLVRGSIDLFLTQKGREAVSICFRKITVTDIYDEDLFSLVLSCITATQFKRLSAYSKYKQAYTNLDGEKSHIVNTAWAMLALMKAGQVMTYLKVR